MSTPNFCLAMQTSLDSVVHCRLNDVSDALTTSSLSAVQGFASSPCSRFGGVVASSSFHERPQPRPRPCRSDVVALLDDDDDDDDDGDDGGGLVVVRFRGDGLVRRDRAVLTDPNAWLNDVVMNWWFHRTLVESRRTDVCVALSYEPFEERVAVVSRSGLVDYVVAPVCRARHWFVVVARVDDGMLYVMDSLPELGAARQFARELKYPFTPSHIKCPKQGDAVSCGVFACAFVEALLQRNVGIREVDARAYRARMLDAFDKDAEAARE